MLSILRVLAAQSGRRAVLFSLPVRTGPDKLPVRGERPNASGFDLSKGACTGLVVKMVADEVLVYDLEIHRAHSVNRVVAAVRRHPRRRSHRGRTPAGGHRAGHRGGRALRAREAGQARLLAAPVPGC